MNRDEIELAATKWFKSSWSNGQANCVEVAFLSGGRIGVRDSKDKDSGPVQVYFRSEWEAFLEGARSGEFDLG